jgi:hypothetical protein
MFSNLLNDKIFYLSLFQVILLGLKLEELSWDYAKPSQENNDDCLPCLFIQVEYNFQNKYLMYKDIFKLFRFRSQIILTLLNSF